jgi:proteic killer suppression protein
MTLVTLQAWHYMIQSFKHRGLQRLFDRGDRSKIRPDLVTKVERVLARLDASTDAQDMDVPGFGLHAMTGDRKGYWSVVVSRNWRVIFRFDDGHACDVDFVDYH